jgi:hypothetical protein
MNDFVMMIARARPEDVCWGENPTSDLKIFRMAKICPAVTSAPHRLAPSAIDRNLALIP